MNADEAAQQLRPYLESSPTHPSSKLTQDAARRKLESWGDDALVRVSAEDADPPQELMDALALFRFAARSIIWVNVDSHLFGLVGDFVDEVREFIDVLEEAVPPIAATGWSRAGGLVGFTFGVERLAELDRHPAVRLLRTEIPEPSSTMGRKALLALRVWDSGVRSLDPNLRILTAIQAVEIILSDSEDKPQSLKIARRGAYLTCSGECGRTEPHCLYTQAPWAQKPLFEEIYRLSRESRDWECSAFLSFAAPKELLPSLTYTPMYEVRNQFIHEGRADIGKKERSILLARAERLLVFTMEWAADHPGMDIDDLDNEMGVR